MAHDPRRSFRVTLTEEQASWIEDKFGGPEAAKADAIKTLIDQARNPAPAPATTAAPASAVTCKAVDHGAAIDSIAATLDLFYMKYMIDHPEKEVTRALQVKMETRWNGFEDLRRITIAKAKSHAP